MPDNKKQHPGLSDAKPYNSETTPYGYIGAPTADLGKTDFGKESFDTDNTKSTYILDPQKLEALRGERQGWGAETVNAIGGGLAKIPFSVIGNVASMLDLEDYVNTDNEVGNAVTAWAEEVKGDIESATKIYKSNDNTLGSREWWMNNGKGLIDSAGGFVLTGAGLGKGVQLLSQLAKGSKVIQGIGTVTNAAMLNQAESIPIAMDVYKNTYTLSLGKQQAKVEFGELTQEQADELAKTEAADAAAYSININRINIPLNLTSASAFLRPIAATRQVAKDYTRKEVVSNIFKEGAQEYLEENVNMVAEKEAIRKAADGNKYVYDFDNTVNDVLSKEGFETGLVGFIGGIVQTGATDLVKSFQKDSPSYDINGNVKTDERGQPILVTPQQSQRERFRAQQKSLKEIETLASVDGIPSVKETLDNIKKTSQLVNDIQIASLENKEDLVKSLKNELLTNQAVNSFKNGTTEQLVNLYESLTKDPEAVNKYGQEVFKTSREAITHIENLEKIYNNHSSLPQVNEVINNRSQHLFNIDSFTNLKTELSKITLEQSKEIDATSSKTPEQVDALATTKELQNILGKMETISNNLNKLNTEYQTITNPVYTEKYIKDNNKKKEAEVKVNTDIEKESIKHLPTTSLKAEKADIERRRQEELDSSTKRYNITKESNLTNNNKIRKFYVWESTDGSSTVAPDNIALNDTKALTEWHESKGHIKVWKEEKVQSDKEFEKSNKENELEYNERNKKINAKYDAELAALDNKKKEVTPVEVELAEVKDTTLDGIVKAYNAETLEEFEPLYESLQKQKHLISEHDLKGLEVKRANLILSKPTPPDVIPDEEVEITISKDQDIVSQTLSKITSSSETEVNQLNDSKDVNNFENQRGIRNSNSTIMMKLFEHTFDKNGMFKWKRNEEGLPLLDNNSLLNIHAINQVQVGDSVTFKLVDLNAQQTSNYILQKVNSLEKGKLSSGDRYVNEEDFDDKHIAIYYKDTKIGFVQQPHSINPTTRSIENSLELRKELIKYRKAVISKLEAGEEVTEKISEKGNGNLYTKLKEDGSIDLINDIFQTPRSKDLIDNTLVFVYSNGEELVLPESEFSIEDTKTIKEVIGKFKKYGKSGKIYQLVQDLNKSWAPIPVYSNRMDATSIKSIMDIINSLDNTSDPKRTVALLNDYIYSSMGKVTADIIVRNLGDILEFSINGTIYNLDEIKNKGPRTDDFINELKTKRQNININKINNFYYQEGLKKRNALSTNVTTFEGEYFVQPYIEYTKTLIEEPKQSTQLNENVDVTSKLSTDNTTSTLDDKYKDIDEDSIMNGDDAFSKTLLTNKELNRSEFKKWLSKNLPQFTLSDVELLKDIKDNSVDAYGMFRDSTIYLFEGATMGIAYHEAFHGVFRNLLSNEDKFKLIEEAISKYTAPTTEDLYNLQQGLTRDYNNEELTFLYYEEKLAEAFDKFSTDYNNKSIGDKILAFFNKILAFFKLVKSNPNDNIEELFNNIHKGNYSNIQSSPKGTKIINRELQIDNAYSRKLDEAGFKPSEKLKFTQSIGNQFLKIYQDNLLANKDIRPLLIWEEIKDRYTEYALNANLETDLIAGVKAKRIVQNFNEFRKEATKYLSFRGVRINEEYLEFGNDLIEDNLGDEEVEALRSTTTKGFGDWTSVSGLSSASTRIKLFLSSIPIIDDNGNPKVDMFGIQEYYDFNKLYYYIERNLTDLYTFEDQLEELKRLSVGHPEIQQVVNMLENKSSDITNEQFVQIQNDFKTNFSKQQMSFTLVKFDTNSSTGEVNFRILDANRQSLKREIFETWSKNLEDDTRKTITEFTKEGDINKFGTSTVKELSSKWDKLQSTKGILNYSVVNDILTKLGIDFTPSVLEGLIKDNTNEFRSNISKVLKYYSDNIDSDTFNVNEKTGRIALSELVNYEVNASFDSYTSSFNNVENKAIYTIQLPSFASRLISRLRSTNVNVFRNTITELEKDSFYKHSNLLEELKTDVTFRKNGFKLSYIDGLKDEKGESKGSKFTNMTPKDFLSMEVALFQNTAANSNKKAKESLHKYVYITPSDKTMGMIFDAKAYEVTLTNDNINLNSEILGKFYNIFLQESNRIKHNLLIKDDILANKDNSKYLLSDLLQYYHISKSNWDDFSELADKQANGETLTDKEWNSISKMFTGQAFQYNYFSQSFNSIIKRTIADTMLSSTLEDLEKNLESFRDTILVEMRKELQYEYKNTREEFKNKGIISKNDKTGLYENIALSLTSKDSQNVNNEINQLIANFSLNTMLHNIEFSNLLNGDVSLYKPNDLQKRTYQSQSMITNNNFENKIIKTMVIKDYETGSQQYENIVSTLKQLGFTDDQIKPIAGKYKKGINVTDAQVYITPEFYKRIHISRGTWSPEMQEAYDIAEGKKTGIISEAYHRLLAGIKPFYFGNRFDSHLGIQRYEQVKCAMLPLFKSYIDLNPLLASKRQEMSNLGVDMLAHESSFKATIGNRNDITGDPGIVLELNTDNFGIQVDNPDHTTEGNDSMRQLKMLILGSIDTTKTYKGISGKQIIEDILTMEASNIKESFNLLQQKMDFKNNIDFANFIKDAITKRGATINIEEALNIIDGDFEYALDNGNLSTQIENMISSIYTNNVIKQEFAVGGSTVQASSIGFKYKNLEEQQEGLTEDAKLLQQQLSWIKPNLEDGSIGYAECAMPAWSKDFFESNGKLKDIDSIPEELKQLLTYRIPTEGLHSMLPIKVVKFLPETMGNFMLLPYEVTTQLGADFDFDKTYFIGKEFYKDTTDGENINLVPYKYINGTDNESLSERWKQYHKYTSINRLPQKYETIEDFKELSIEDQNVKGARNNKILENYLHLLTSIENLELLITPSGFDTLSYFKDKYFKEQSKTHGDDSFFSSRIQRDYKERNHIGIALKGQSALHVSGHSYATLMNLVSKTPIKFNGIVSDNFSGLYTKNGKLIADELSSIMAAILDDIKNPLLKYLGINNNTIDVLATVIRAGYNMDTALRFISQPAVKKLADLLNKNKDKIKKVGQGFYSIDTTITTYTNTLNSFENTVPDLQSIIDSSYYTNISDKELDKALTEPQFGGTDEEQAKRIAFQLRVLRRFQDISEIADELVNINKFFAINKEVGPNIENIIAKTDIYEQILASTIITGFDINKIPSLKETYEVHKNALKWFERYFPYSTDTYLDIKKQLLSLQTSKKLNQIPIEDKMFMNGFIRAYMDYSSDTFNKTSYKYNNLFKELPLLIKDIKDAAKKDNKLGNLTYKQIRQNTFIENIKVSLDKDNNIWNITLKGNRIDLQVKNNIIQGFEALYNNTSTKQLAIDLIEHSFVSSGFFSGLNNYSNLINPNILKDLGYNTFRKNIVNNLRNNLVSLQESADLENDKKDIEIALKQAREDINRIVDQIIRNNPKPFTKVFDDTMFGINGKALPDTITTTEAAVKEAKRGSDFFFGDTEDPSTPTYIRVYDKERKRSSIFKKDINNNFKYKKIDNLGKKGYFMEINPSEDITKSYLKENSGISKNTMESDFEDEISQEALNIPEGIDNAVLSTKVNKYEITDEEDFLNTKVSEIIYNELGNKTKSKNVKLVKWGDLRKYIKSIETNLNGEVESIVATRIPKVFNHFGNPFSHDPAGKAKGLIKTETIREAVEKYIDWVINSNEDRPQWIRKQLKSGNLKNKPILYYTELGEPSHATALDYLINKYDWNNKSDGDITKNDIDNLPPIDKC